MGLLQFIVNFVCSLSTQSAENGFHCYDLTEYTARPARSVGEHQIHNTLMVIKLMENVCMAWSVVIKRGVSQLIRNIKYITFTFLFPKDLKILDQYFFLQKCSGRLNLLPC